MLVTIEITKLYVYLCFFMFWRKSKPLKSNVKFGKLECFGWCLSKFSLRWFFCENGCSNSEKKWTKYFCSLKMHPRGISRKKTKKALGFHSLTIGSEFCAIFFAPMSFNEVVRNQLEKLESAKFFA